MSPRVPWHILPVVVLAQFAGTSLWFGANAVLAPLQRQWALDPASQGLLLLGVNAGFIVGTLVYAWAMVADRVSPRRVFLISSLLAAAGNLVCLLAPQSFAAMVASRLLVGFFLAGIYPVGMKIASGWFHQGLGHALGFLVGALVFGTAMPHALRAYGADWPWAQVLVVLSGVAVAGGLLVYALVPDGPYLARGQRVQLRSLAVIWQDPKVRASALGYFGHMWELYAMFVSVPAIIAYYLHTGPGPAVSLLSAIVIGIGGVGCIVGGLLVRRVGGARVATTLLAVSGSCALLSVVMFEMPWWAFAVWMLAWGTSVSADSPQFSALTANNSPRAVVGSVLTLVNCLGFAISLVSIQTVTIALAVWPPSAVLPWLAIGPAIGVWSMMALVRSRA
ncbi:MAG: MFS transporter [Burkholderiaceae bacterium]